VIALQLDVLDLDAGRVKVTRTVVEVNGHTTTKHYPKSRAGVRTIPLPNWVVTELRAHLEKWPVSSGGLIFPNEAGFPLRRSMFRTRVWRPSLVRAGLLGEVRIFDDEPFEAVWTDRDGKVHAERFDTHREAVDHVARHQFGGLRFHDLRGSYGTWLADDGVSPNKIQKVMGHENFTTTMKLYVRKTEDHDAILDALDDDDDEEEEEEEEEGPSGAAIPAR
jgi:integrase